MQMSREFWLTHIPMSERHPSYQKVISHYSGAFLLHLVPISSYLPSCNSPPLSHLPKPFTDDSPILPHLTVNLPAISDAHLGLRKIFAVPLLYPIIALLDSPKLESPGCGFLCWPIPFNKAVKGCSFVGEPLPLQRLCWHARLACKGCARLGLLARWCDGERSRAEGLDSEEQPLWSSFL